MKVTVRIPQNLRGYCDDRELIEVDGARVGDVLTNLTRRFPLLAPRLVDAGGRLLPHLIIIRNEHVLPRRDVHEVTLAEDDELRVFTAAAGG